MSRWRVVCKGRYEGTGYILLSRYKPEGFMTALFEILSGVPSGRPFTARLGVRVKNTLVILDAKIYPRENP
jgi:hypothetical protein